MGLLSRFLARGAAESSASELFQALQAAEADRRKLREREQKLAASRSSVLLDGTDAELDAIENELTKIGREAERHDIRIPELRRLHEERATAERRESDKQAFDEATGQRLALAERIDAKLAELGALFDALEQPAEILRGLSHYHRNRGLNGPMLEFRPDGQDVRMALLKHVPHAARAIGIGEFGGHKARSYHAAESDVLTILRGGTVPTPVRAEGIVHTAADAEIAERDRARDTRYLGS